MIRDIAAGYLHTCGILTNGSAVCWGASFASRQKRLGAVGIGKILLGPRLSERQGG